MKYTFLIGALSLFFCGCLQDASESKNPRSQRLPDSPYIVVLGVAQDGGYPHINNNNEFSEVASGERQRALVVSLGLVDPILKSKYLFEATPDMPEQLSILEREHLKTDQIIDGVFLTHAHMGHYTGLMHFGREALGGKDILVMAMPRMKSFLETNEPWKQLSTLNNINLMPLVSGLTIQTADNVSVKPFLVPHRDEFSETVGYKIAGPNKTALFIPDIDKWSKWDKDLLQEVEQVDYAFLDATFFADGEIPRPMSEVPHPFVTETVSAFAKANRATKSKVIFIHFNHSNPALNPAFEGRKELERQGFRFANQGDIFSL